MFPVLRSAAIAAVIFSAYPYNSAHAAIPTAERQILLDLYNNTNGGSWTIATGWNGAVGTECSWRGIVCDGPGSHVVSIALIANNLGGHLPPLSGLAFLEKFDVHGNHIAGSVPVFTGLAALRVFDVWYNNLTGPMPAISTLTHLEYFSVAGNQLSGPLPSPSGLSNLRTFSAAFNQLTGAVPALTSLPSLEVFDVGANQLTGALPSISALTSLQSIFVDSNHLSGDIPSPPASGSLRPGYSIVCPNHFNAVPNADWDVATAQTPWYQNCTSLPDPVYADGFDGVVPPSR